MITPLATDTNVDVNVAATTRTAARPYAGPRSGNSSSSASAMQVSRPEPYRPVLARGAQSTTPRAATSSDDLPWIDQFLSNTPVQVASIDAEAPHMVAQAEPELTATIVEDVWVTPIVASHVVPVADSTEPLASAAAPVVDAPVAESPASEDWPLEEASAQLAEMLPALQRKDSDADVPERLFAENAADDTLAPWTDDDMIDIMPVSARPLRPTTHATPIVQVAPVLTSGEVAARSLELVAQRVRSGELTLPGYDPALGDSAALIAALAALHGVR